MTKNLHFPKLAWIGSYINVNQQKFTLFRLFNLKKKMQLFVDKSIIFINFFKPANQHTTTLQLEW